MRLRDRWRYAWACNGPMGNLVIIATLACWLVLLAYLGTRQ